VSLPVAVDPALQMGLRLSLALVLGTAARHKLRDADAFRGALADYRLLPERWTAAAARALAAGELAVGVALLVPGLAPAGGVAAAALLLLYTGAIAINLGRGRRSIDCGCAGPGARRPLGPGLVARNAVLVCAAATCALPVAGRPFVWLDVVTVAAGVPTLAFLYGAIDTSLAQGARRRAVGGGA
jgi:uncharacterized membrane protein YphA (DoxX/SURF4 family)